MDTATFSFIVLKSMATVIIPLMVIIVVEAIHILTITLMKK